MLEKVASSDITQRMIVTVVLPPDVLECESQSPIGKKQKCCSTMGCFLLAICKVQNNNQYLADIRYQYQIGTALLIRYKLVVSHTSPCPCCCLFTHQEEFLSLSVDKLTDIIASDFLNVPNEEVVFEAAMQWLNKCSTRKQSFEKV